MLASKSSRPYLDAWLRRTSRQFAVSGRLTQIATVLTAEDGGSLEQWKIRLRTLLEGGDLPSLDLLTRIDALLAGQSSVRCDDGAQGLLF